MITEKELNELAELEKKAQELSSLCFDTHHKATIDKIQSEKTSFMPRLLELRNKQMLTRKEQEDSELQENLKYEVKERNIRISHRGTPIKIDETDLTISVTLNCGHTRKMKLYSDLLNHAQWELVLKHGAILEPSLTCGNQCQEEIKDLEKKWRKSDKDWQRLATLKKGIFPTTIKIIRV